MMMFLTLLFVGLFSVAVLSVIVYGTSPRDAARPEARPEVALGLGAPRFFGEELVRPAARSHVPIEVVIAQFEKHVRLEQAAAESFLDAPARATLYSPTTSQFLN